MLQQLKRLPALSISAVMPDGHIPYSHFRTQNVGVGGSSAFFCGPFTGGPVRRATLAELRHLDRCTVLRIMRDYPEASIRIERSH